MSDAGDSSEPKLPATISSRSLTVSHADRQRIAWLGKQIIDYRASAASERIAARIYAEQSEASAERQAEHAENGAKLAIAVGGGGGTVITTALGAVLATTTVVTTSMIVATGAGVLAIAGGFGLAYLLGRQAINAKARAKEWAILSKEFGKADAEGTSADKTEKAD